MDMDQVAASGSRSSSELFGDFGLQWDEYEVPFDPMAAIDGDG